CGEALSLIYALVPLRLSIGCEQEVRDEAPAFCTRQREIMFAGPSWGLDELGLLRSCVEQETVEKFAVLVVQMFAERAQALRNRVTRSGLKHGAKVLLDGR